MGFKNRKRDDHGHVIGNDEVDGQKCQHVNGGGSGSDNKQPKIKEFGSEKEAKEYFNKNADKLPDGTVMYGNKIYADNFDNDYDAEFTEADEKQYVDKVMDDISRANDKKAFEYVADNIDELTEAGLISEETSDRLYDALDSKIDESGENMSLFNTDLQRDREEIAEKEFDFQDAINLADDGTLDEQFGKDTSERKLMGAVKKQNTPKSKFIDSVVNGNNFDKRYKETVKQLDRIPDEEIETAVNNILEGKDYFDRNKRIGENVQRLVNKYLSAIDKSIPEPYPSAGYNMAIAEMLENEVNERRNPKNIAEDLKQEQAPDKDEMDLIDKEKSQRTAKEKQVQHFVDKAKELKKQGKMSDIWNMLRGLDDDTANRVLEELMGK